MREKILQEFQELDLALIALGFTSVIEEQPNGAVLFVCGPLECSILAPPDIPERNFLAVVQIAVGHLFGAAMMFFAVHHEIPPRIPEQVEPLHVFYVSLHRRIQELWRVGQ